MHSLSTFPVSYTEKEEWKLLNLEIKMPTEMNWEAGSQISIWGKLQLQRKTALFTSLTQALYFIEMDCILFCLLSFCTFQWCGAGRAKRFLGENNVYFGNIVNIHKTRSYTRKQWELNNILAYRPDYTSFSILIQIRDRIYLSTLWPAIITDNLLRKVQEISLVK